MYGQKNISSYFIPNRYGGECTKESSHPLNRPPYKYQYKSPFFVVRTSRSVERFPNNGGTHICFANAIDCEGKFYEYIVYVHMQFSTVLTFIEFPFRPLPATGSAIYPGPSGAIFRERICGYIRRDENVILLKKNLACTATQTPTTTTTTTIDG